MNHELRREQDEFYCRRCDKRWAVNEEPPPCAPVGKGKPMITDENGTPLWHKTLKEA